MKRERSRRLLRLAGWLLTPVVVWAASFLGGWVGALVAGASASHDGDLVWLVSGAIVGGTAGLVGWLWLARRSRA